MTAYVGIDPGLDGGLAAITDDNLYVVRRPTANDHGKRQIDTATILTIFVEIGPSIIAVEDVNAGAVPGRGSAFAFGRGVGRIEGVITALGRPCDYVRPQRWLRDLGIGVGATKAEHIATARRLFPAVTIDTDGQADALLIAEWCRRTWRK